MRTKKQIRRIRKVRFVGGIALMVIAAALMILGFVAMECGFFVFTDLQDGKLATTFLVITITLWYIGCLMLFISGGLIFVKRNDVYFKYPSRPLSSKL